MLKGLADSPYLSLVPGIILVVTALFEVYSTVGHKALFQPTQSTQVNQVRHVTRQDLREQGSRSARLL